MKKLNIFLIGALTCGFMACDDKSDLGIEQTNPQLPMVDVSGLTLTLSPELSAGVNLNSYTATTLPVVVVETPIVDLPSSAIMAYDMEVSSNIDFTDQITINVENESINTSDLEDACTTFYGLNPSMQKMYVRFAAYIMEGSQQSRVGGVDKYYGISSFEVTPIDAKLDIESEYYLVFGNNSLPFEHSASHPYIDPKFTLKVELTAADMPMNWTIRSASGRTYGVEENTIPNITSGSLVEGGQPGVLNEEGTYVFSVNMLDLTYSIAAKANYDYLYTPGPATGWGFGDNMLLYTYDYEQFQGFVYVDGEFKLCAQPDWNPLNWGVDKSLDGQIAPLNGNLVPDGANIKVATSGLYWVQTQMLSFTYELTEITNISLIGGFNGWNGDLELTPNDTFKVWTGTLTLDSAGEWKFRMNHDWAINLGGSLDDLSVNGDNIYTEAGIYTVTLDLSKLPYSATVVKN